MLLYADEDFSLTAVIRLRQFGYDVFTVQEDGLRARPDADVLSRAYSLRRIVITFNRRHFQDLHRLGSDHCDIVSVTHDDDAMALADRIHTALLGRQPGRWCIRVNRSP